MHSTTKLGIVEHFLATGRSRLWNKILKIKYCQRIIALFFKIVLITTESFIKIGSEDLKRLTSSHLTVHHILVVKFLNFLLDLFLGCCRFDMSSHSMHNSIERLNGFNRFGFGLRLVLLLFGQLIKLIVRVRKSRTNFNFHFFLSHFVVFFVPEFLLTVFGYL